MLFFVGIRKKHMRTFFNKAFWKIFGILFFIAALDAWAFLSGNFADENGMKFATDPHFIENIFFALFLPVLSLSLFFCGNSSSCAWMSTGFPLYVFLGAIFICSVVLWSIVARILFFVGRKTFTFFKTKIVSLKKK